MVNIIENKAKIEATVLSIDPNGGPAGYCQIDAQLNDSSEVEGFRDLAKADVGSVITINIRPAQLEEYKLEKGSHLCGTVRKVPGQRYFLEEG